MHEKKQEIQQQKIPFQQSDSNIRKKKEATLKSELLIYKNYRKEKLGFVGNICN